MNPLYGAFASGNGPIRAVMFVAEEAATTISLTKHGSSPPTLDMSYSADGVTWVPFVPGETVIQLPHIGDRVFVRANSVQVFGANNNSLFWGFSIAGKARCRGNAAYLIGQDGGGPLEGNYINRYYALKNAFNGCTGLTLAPDLDKIWGSDQNKNPTGIFSGLDSTFSGCTALREVPKLPVHIDANTLKQTFYGCTALTSAHVPAIQSVSYASTYRMTLTFAECSNLAEMTVAFTTWPSHGSSSQKDTVSWLEGVAETGVFRCPTHLYWSPPTGVDTVPAGWTVERF